MTDMKNEIREIFKNYRGQLPIAYRWEDEKDRWHEFVYCIFSELSGTDEATSRQIVNALANLQLLEIDDLSNAKTDTKEGTRLLELLLMNGVKKEQAEKTVIAICEAAKGIKTNCAKLQNFLRIQGKKMLDDLDGTISFSSIGKDQENRIFITWIQNVLEIPIPLSNHYVEEFCKEKQCKIEDLIDAADALDFNVAVLDDLIELYMLDLKRKIG